MGQVTDLNYHSAAKTPKKFRFRASKVRRAPQGKRTKASGLSPEGIPLEGSPEKVATSERTPVQSLTGTVTPRCGSVTAGSDRSESSIIRRKDFSASQAPYAEMAGRPSARCLPDHVKRPLVLLAQSVLWGQVEFRLLSGSALLYLLGRGLRQAACDRRRDLGFWPRLNRRLRLGR